MEMSVLSESPMQCLVVEFQSRLIVDYISPPCIVRALLLT